MRHYLYPGEVYDVQIDIRFPDEPRMSLGGVLDDYNTAYPVSDKTKQARARELDKIVTSELNKLIRFMMDTAHQPLQRGAPLWIDIKFKELYFSFCSFDIYSITYRIIEGKPMVWVTVTDYMANGGGRTADMIAYQKKAKSKKKAAQLKK